MEKYVNVYDFKVVDEISKGETIYVVDRQMRVVGTVNELSINEVFKILDNAELGNGRYDFYKVEVVENE
jgi:hypothetical protein